MEQNEEMRVIAVGDDDQNIFEFRGASSKHLEQFIHDNQAIKHELVENYRSKSNLVDFANQFVKRISHRLKQTPIIAKQNDNGNIRIVHYQSGNLINPLVQDILTTSLSGTTCILTKTNEEAQEITGLLLKNNQQAKLIQSNDDFSLYNLYEIRYFLSHLNLADDIYSINDDVWLNAKREVVNKFRHSTKLDILGNIIKEFEVSNPKRKYKSDLEVFIRESKLEDFFNENGETIFVSTIHKAKGKEFDNVFIVLENYNIATDEAKRLLYVALTRVKTNLAIHLNSTFLDNITANNLERIENKEFHFQSNEIALNLSLKDVWLDYFIYRQKIISELISGDALTVSEDGCMDNKGNSLLKFSKQFVGHIENMKAKNYELKSAKVNFIVYWKKEETGQEVKIILPELYFVRSIDL